MGVDGEKTQNRIGRLPRSMTKSVKMETVFEFTEECRKFSYIPIVLQSGN